MRRPRRPRFAGDDVLQQLVGGILLSGPFVVTEEVWQLAANMTVLHVGLSVGLVASIGYGALFLADRRRDVESESEIGGVPKRFISLMGVSYGSVLLLTYLLAAPQTFLGGSFVAPGHVMTVVAIGAIFAVVGAATADSIF